MKINADFPGGNIVVRAQQGNYAALSPELRDTEGYWFYWCMEVEFDTPGEYRFEFDSIAIGARGPALSEDGGRTWRWLEFDGCTDCSFLFQAAKPGKVQFCTSMQYLQSDLERFLHAVPAVTRSVFCRSLKGREVEFLRIGAENPKHKVLLTSRHHCCEMMATHVLEGILRAAAAEPEILKDTAFFAVPFVDKDGVEEGDQGKNRLPHDHARDYGRPDPIYPETQAITQWIETEKPEIVFDLHCPWLKNDGNELLHFVGPEPKRMEQMMDKWAVLLEKELPPEIPYSPENNARFGSGWNTAANYTKGRTLAKYAADQDEIRAALSIEIPYANAQECTLDVMKAHEIGAALYRVITATLADIE